MTNKNSNRNTSIQSIDVRSYSDIRKLIRHAYLYGTYSDKDYISYGVVNVKERQLAYIWSNIKTYFNIYQQSTPVLSDTKLPNRKKDKKARKIFIDPFIHNAGFLASTYNHFSLNKNDILYYLFFLLAFNNETVNNPYEVYNEDFIPEFLPYYTDDEFDLGMFVSTLSDMWINNNAFIKNIDINNLKFIGNNTPFSTTTIYKFLEELCDYGLLNKRVNSGKRVLYSLPKDIISFNEYSFNTASSSRKQLINMIDFFCNVLPFTVPGFYIKQKISLYNIVENNTSELSQNIVFKRSNYQNIVDEDIVWSLLEYIDHKESICYQYNSSSGNALIFKVIPIKIIIDNQYGRQYLFGYGYSQKSFVMHRIDFIDDLEIYDNPPALPKSIFEKTLLPRNCDLDVLYDNYFNYHFNEAFNIEPSAKDRIHVRLYFDFSSSTDYTSYLEKKLINGPYGIRSIKTSDSHYKLDLFVTNPSEMIPWIHSFADTITVDEKVCPSLYNTLKKQSLEWQKMYETL